MPGTLYVVSTPIGNLEDITLRALNVLKAVALVAAEDTRRTGNLLRHYGIATPTTSLHEHNEHEKVPRLIERLRAGDDIAVVSDAGTPVVADPGQRVVAAAWDAGIRVVPVPGASALLATLAASGFAGDEFVFAGFAPSRSKDRQPWLQGLVTERRPIIIFETPHRIHETLQEISQLFGERPIVIGRELTKLHEELLKTTAGQVGKLGPLKAQGEFCIVLGEMTNLDPSGDRDLSTVAIYFGQLAKNTALTRRQAAAQTAQHFGLSTNEVYALLERVKHTPEP